MRSNSSFENGDRDYRGIESAAHQRFSWFWLALVLFLTASRVVWAANITDSLETATLSICLGSPTGVVITSSPLRFSAYRVQTSPDLVRWQNTGVTFGPSRNAVTLESGGESNLFFRLESDNSLALSVLEADATTIQLNWPPIPTAVEYRVYRDGAYVGSTAGRCGYFLDTGLSPVTSYEYALAAFDADTSLIARSSTNQFSTTAMSHVRTEYNLLAVAFYPNGPDPGQFPHIKSYFRHRLDFVRLASVNSAILHPYKGDVISIAAAPPLRPTGPFNIDYAKLAETAYPELDGYSIVDLVERGDIDVVWVLDTPEGSVFAENALVGNKDLNPNPWGEKWNPFPARCSRSFFVNAGSADARVFDAYTHYAEGVMSALCDGYSGNWPRTYGYSVYSNMISLTNTHLAKLNLFERFRLADQWNGPGAYASAGNGNCGSSHFPPNARRDTDDSYHGDYAYYDHKTWQRYIDCSADEWLQFPMFTGAKRWMNGYDFGAFNNYTEPDVAYGAAFGASPELHPSFRWATDSYHLWWFFQLPHNPGVADGKLNNWWPYLFDFNRFNGSEITYPVTGFSELPSFDQVGGEYGTESASSAWWGYWHSCSDFGPVGQVSAVPKTLDPAVVFAGEYGLRVLIDQDSFQHNGRNDVFYPISRDAGWNLSGLREIRFAIKLGLGPDFIQGANPVIRLCANPGNRIEFAPINLGRYANHFSRQEFQSADGWFTFMVPIEGDFNWEVNVIGYVDPILDPIAIVAAKRNLMANILDHVNYVEISIHSTGDRGTQVSYFLDGIEFHVGESLR